MRDLRRANKHSQPTLARVRRDSGQPCPSRHGTCSHSGLASPLPPDASASQSSKLTHTLSTPKHTQCRNNLGKTWSILMMLGAKYDDAGVEGRRQERVRGKERRKQISRRAQKRYLTRNARKRSEQERKEGRGGERGMRALAIASDKSVGVERLQITEL